MPDPASVMTDEAADRCRMSGLGRRQDRSGGLIQHHCAAAATVPGEHLLS